MAALSTAQMALGSISGSLVGLSLGLVGGGGSILAVPLVIYLVGVPNPHVAIGTSAVAVAANAAVNLANHARAGHVKWPCATVFSAAGIAGAFGGSTLGKMLDGQKLLLVFALLMLVVGALMLRRRADEGDFAVRLGRDNFPALVGFGLATGALSGFFGIGGGFLIVPALMLATGMPILNAIGSSLVAVTAFGLTTAFNYALSGLVDWALVIVFLAGGVIGGLIGGKLAKQLSDKRGALNNLFAALIFAVAIYMLYRNWMALSFQG
ncbi:sulfite exporter TauE/SafE family protein [Bradyrhizobium sp. USDA 10063]